MRNIITIVIAVMVIFFVNACQNPYNGFEPYEKVGEKFISKKTLYLYEDYAGSLLDFSNSFDKENAFKVPQGTTFTVTEIMIFLPDKRHISMICEMEFYLNGKKTRAFLNTSSGILLGENISNKYIRFLNPDIFVIDQKPNKL